MTLQRFVERRLLLTPEQIQARLPGAVYVMRVEIYLDRPFRGMLTITCDGPIMKAFSSVFSWLTAEKGPAYSFNIDTSKEKDATGPIVLTVFAKSEIHVRDLMLGE